MEATPKGMVLIHGARRLVYEPPYDGETRSTARWIGGATLGAEGDELVYRSNGKAFPVGLESALVAWLMDDAL